MNEKKMLKIVVDDEMQFGRTGQVAYINYDNMHTSFSRTKHAPKNNNYSRYEYKTRSRQQRQKSKNAIKNKT